jgi:hypothetical protein
MYPYIGGKMKKLNLPKYFAKFILDRAYPKIYKRTLHNHRIAISQRIYSEFGGTVRYGRFKGMELATSLKFVTPDFSSMFFGTYEKELISSIENIPDSYCNFINLGAGDGYYPIGSVKSGIFTNCIAYEENEERRDQMMQLANRANVQNFIQIRGFAGINCFEEFDLDFLSKTVILSDIEGGEFEIFNAKNLAILSKSIIFIEIHDFLVYNGSFKFKQLIKDSETNHKITQIRISNRDPLLYSELHKFTDIDRWIAMSEGRGPIMFWLRLDPKG